MTSAAVTRGAASAFAGDQYPDPSPRVGCGRWVLVRTCGAVLCDVEGERGRCAMAVAARGGVEGDAGGVHQRTLGAAGVQQAGAGHAHQQLQRPQQRDRGQSGEQLGGQPVGGVGDVQGHRDGGGGGHEGPGVPGVPPGIPAQVAPEDDQAGGVVCGRDLCASRRGGGATSTQRRTQQSPLTHPAKPSGRMNHTELPSDSALPRGRLGDCELELLASCPAKAGRQAPTAPAAASPSGSSLLVGLALLDLGRHGQRATSEVAPGDDRAGVARLDGHGLSTAGEVGTHWYGVVQDRSGRGCLCWHAANSKLLV
jgi:hypothetical protein